jgi:hypothetical protein
VIVTMSWLTREEGRVFSRMPQEPDMETLTYWLQRLEPLIRAETDEEIIVVFCNRTGTEEEAVYAGTSAVIGIRGGEVNVYGLLGRGVKDLLVVDTEKSAYAKLVHRPDGGLAAAPKSAETEQPPSTNGNSLQERKSSTTAAGSARSTSGDKAIDSAVIIPETSARIGRPAAATRPRIVIPTTDNRRTKRSESPTVPTPTGPSPTPEAMRPRVTTVDSPYPGHNDSPYHTRSMVSQGNDKYHILGGNVSIIHEGFEESDGEVDPASASDNASLKYFWPTWTAKGSEDSRARRRVQGTAESPTAPSSLVWLTPLGSPTHGRRSQTNDELDDASSIISSHGSLSGSLISSRSAKSRNAQRAKSRQAQQVNEKPRTAPPTSDSAGDESMPARPSSPKSRNASRQRNDRRASISDEQVDMQEISEKLKALGRRPGSAMDQQRSTGDGQNAVFERPPSPKSRNASRNRDWQGSNVLAEDQYRYPSSSSIPIAASPSIFDDHMQQSLATVLNEGRQNTQSPFRRPSGSGSNLPGRRPTPTATQSMSGSSLLRHHSVDRSDSRTGIRGRQHLSKANPTEQALASYNAAEQRQDSGERRSSSNYRLARPDDEIISIHEYIDPQCQMHGEDGSASQGNTPANGGGRPSVGSLPRASPPQQSPPNQPATHQSTLQNDSVVQPSLRQSPHGSTQSQIQSASTSIDKVAPAASNGTVDSPEGPPQLVGSSILTISSPERSPGTPRFEPSTPKAMSLKGFEFDAKLPSTTTNTSSSNGPGLSIGNSLVEVVDRPKSSVY